ncbi:hypothetical protein B0H19DRAFT_1158530 [Mycena capillaripes]|nr:hypothetical protein B0H19DRAFT_1158530 [Mycena capillaripes]
MSSQHAHHDSAPATVLYSRTLGPNELSYYLPSRAYGLNDMFTRVIFRAPPALVSPFRLQVAWAIMKLQDSIYACKIEMAPGCYDEARFIYTPPSSPNHALEEAAQTLTFHDIKTGAELHEDFLAASGARRLSAQCPCLMDLARHSEVSPGIHEYEITFTLLHTLTDGTSVHANAIFELLGGSATPGGPPRSDAELVKILELEWSQRWRQPRVAFEAITPAVDARLPPLRTRFQVAALKIDSMNVQRRAIGAHAFPRTASQITKQTIVEVKFDRVQTAALFAKSKSEQVTLQNAVFALCNFAWIRTAESHPEINAPKTLPMLFYTAINLRRHLARTSPLTSTLNLALGYGNIVLPAFIPSSADANAMFWLRARSVQSQMRKMTQSPLLVWRSRLMSVERARRAKAFARQDDEADGTLPPRPSAPTQTPKPPAQTPSNTTAPSVALMGVSHLGDWNATYRTERYPSIEFLDTIGHSRRAKGGMLLLTRSVQGRFTILLDWDAAAFPPGLVEEFWGHIVGGVHEFILADTRSRAQSKL